MISCSYNVLFLLLLFLMMSCSCDVLFLQCLVLAMSCSYNVLFLWCLVLTMSYSYNALFLQCLVLTMFCSYDVLVFWCFLHIMFLWCLVVMMSWKKIFSSYDVLLNVVVHFVLTAFFSYFIRWFISENLNNLNEELGAYSEDFISSKTNKLAHIS